LSVYLSFIGIFLIKIVQKAFAVFLCTGF